MQDIAKLKVLFIAGFGPIVHESGESRKLYRDVLGITSKKKRTVIFILKPFPAQRLLRCGRFLR
jgi:hypothetical protein